MGRHPFCLKDVVTFEEELSRGASWHWSDHSFGPPPHVPRLRPSTLGIIQHKRTAARGFPIMFSRV
jgi:hypothetical protein